MKQTEQRIAIAEFCGWHRTLGGRWVSPIGEKPPDYLHDLNAMHEAEEHAGNEVIKAMRYHLCNICDQMTAHHATAAQRAEAFLRAIGKWKDDPLPVSLIENGKIRSELHGETVAEAQGIAQRYRNGNIDLQHEIRELQNKLGDEKAQGQAVYEKLCEIEPDYKYLSVLEAVTCLKQRLLTKAVCHVVSPVTENPQEDAFYERAEAEIDQANT